jgi:hypothetical protein
MYVYGWQDPSQDPDYRIGGFLRQYSVSEFEDLYSKEREMQALVVDDPEQKIFVSELEQLW